MRRIADASSAPKSRSVALALIGTAGLILYLWPAVAAPVVRWSDSEIDMAAAKRGTAALAGFPGFNHPLKPAYIAYLAVLARTFSPEALPRAAVVANSLIVWAALLFAAALFGRRYGAGFGAAAGAILFAWSRARDAASAVMPEAPALAAFTVLAAVMLYRRPRGAAANLAAGAAAAVLAFVRPNVGLIAITLAGALALGRRQRRGAAALAAGFAAALAGCALIARVGGAPAGRFSGLGYVVASASVDYNWDGELGGLPGDSAAPEWTEKARLRWAAAKWKSLFREPSPDVSRQLLWRAGHGLLGSEYYDASWSRAYAEFDRLSRIASPVLVLATLALLLARLLAGGGREAAAIGAALAVALIGQDLVFGSLPRLVTPCLPVFLLLGLGAAIGGAPAPLRFRSALALTLTGLLFLVARFPCVADWETGKIERAGVRIAQAIPRGALPARAPAVFHLRIAPPLPMTTAGFLVSLDGRLVYDSRAASERASQTIAAAIPAAVLATNRTRAIQLEVESVGIFDPYNCLLFPVIPPPWRAAAARSGDNALSPATGIRSGSLDWWAHEGEAKESALPGRAARTAAARRRGTR